MSEGSAASSDLAVRTRGLTKRFRSGQVAVAGIDLAVPRGAVYGFLGPNGSGKTTTIRMLLGLVAPTSGEIELLGQPLPGGLGLALPRVGALVEGPAFHPYLVGRANLERLDAADATTDPRTRAARIAAALERVGLTAAAGKKYRQYSLGMKQRLGLAAALLRPRDLLLLDEPTNGLDPQGTREVRTLVRELADGGTTVLVSSHLLSEIEQVCSHIGIMSRGNLLVQGPRKDLTATGRAELRVTTSAGQAGHAAQALEGLGLAGPTVRETGATAVLSTELGEVAPEKVSQVIVSEGIDLIGLEVRRPTLENLFVELTGEGFDVAR
ncbi:ABC transporter ATP-binding protein [Paraoerskovia sediminicola]|uniref:ABC transporter ATP-binding protein n=1 Tax=Paraoerskovia sediminicola TaxID=1138587 RepID=A0ABM8FZ35_9CELL|nr:ATP-binding cassette domain-containing protein [Paraoerskovia sediminicola]BDZ40999.1 ABC transporter ATP-binding protein [Paraoerskovia sediminicola]